MKKIFYSLAIVSAAVFSSCEDFLDKEPILNMSPAAVFSTHDRMEAAVKAVYTQFKENSFIGSKAYACIENMGDEMLNVSDNGIEATYSYFMTVGMDTQDNYQTWDGAYRAINSANTALENIEANKEVAGADYDRFIQELKFTRALAYFYLNFFYAQPYTVKHPALSVPLRLVAESSTANNDLARATNEEVFAQILEDTKDYSALPSKGASYNSITRASQAAVLLLRMRVYMNMENWGEAIKCGEAIKLMGYSLAGAVADCFRSDAACPESVFSFPYDSTNKGGGFQSAACYFYANGRSLVFDRESGIYSPLNANYNVEADARVGQLVKQHANGNYISLKYTDNVNYLDWCVLMRYSEVLLNLAECYANNNDDAKAKAELEAVRRRSIAADADPINISALSGAELKKAIIMERRTEFVGEAIRALDIKRRGENFVKLIGTPSEFTVTPSTTGYTWAIPSVERANNKAIVD